MAARFAGFQSLGERSWTTGCCGGPVRIVVEGLDLFLVVDLLFSARNDKPNPCDRASRPCTFKVLICL